MLIFYAKYGDSCEHNCEKILKWNYCKMQKKLGSDLLANNFNLIKCILDSAIDMTWKYCTAIVPSLEM